MRVLIAPDKFKGSLSAYEVSTRLAEGLRIADPALDERIIPVADGGEGTLEAAVHAGFRLHTVTVTGPTGQPTEAKFAVRDTEAVVEMARASGLAVLPDGMKDAVGATSYGTGELIRAAMDQGCSKIVIGVGGSASTDGGAGVLQALGVRLQDDRGEELLHGGAELVRLARADLSGLDKRIASAQIILAGDVRNPLLGSEGAAIVFGPQKGASPADVAVLDKALRRLVHILSESGVADAEEIADLPGAGAAGGVGFGVLAVLDGTFQSGIEVVLDLVGFHDALAGVDLVLTGEGSLDQQTLSGKAPVGVALAAQGSKIPVIAVCGVLQLEEEQWRDAGFSAVYALADRAPDTETSIRDAGRLLTNVGTDIAQQHLRGHHD